MAVMDQHERWAVALSHLVCREAAKNALWLAHPCDAQGNPLAEQPTPEASKHAEQLSADVSEMTDFYGGLLEADDAARKAAGLPEALPLPSIIDPPPPS